MLAIVKDVRKEFIPQYDAEVGKDVLQLMVVVDVHFVEDAGQELHHSQTYAHKPDQVDPHYYQRQADAMQADVDHAKICAERAAVELEQHAAADMKILELRKHHKLDFGEQIPVNHLGRQNEV